MIKSKKIAKFFFLIACPQAGTNKGLWVMLDAHSDLVSAGSVNNDIQGFMVTVESKENYPLTKYEGFLVKPGHVNIVALSATRISATERLRTIPPLKRKCYFKEENQKLVIYKEYTQYNCFLECILLSAQDNVTKTFNRTSPCAPWFFPITENTTSICDPWEAKLFADLVSTGSKESECAHCLPDCEKTIYHRSISSAPLRVCDDANFGLSKYCSMEDPTLPDPKIWGKQVKDEYELNSAPAYIKRIISSERTMQRNPKTFEKLASKYGAYEKVTILTRLYKYDNCFIPFCANIKLFYHK